VPIPEMRTSRWIEVRESTIHGSGVFAARRIPKGTRVIEYLGDRITHKEADDRYEDHDPNDNHTFLFIVDRRTVIDAGVNGNAARFINHSCDGNCTSVIEQRRVFIESTREIAKGEELGYDYEIGREKDDPENVDEIFACRCGSPKCRGTMLYPAEKPAKKKKAKKKVAKKKTAKRPVKKPTKKPTKKKTRRAKGGRGR
jgi:SET domain-containing protein